MDRAVGMGELALIALVGYAAYEAIKALGNKASDLGKAVADKAAAAVGAVEDAGKFAINPVDMEASDKALAQAGAALVVDANKQPDGYYVKRDNVDPAWLPVDLNFNSETSDPSAQIPAIGGVEEAK